ncbi:hypothetical protein NQ317_004047 [Molorchus minor]|uniref:MADF domain-containing protein n=1 Tax=Molorchus minor TaxID=1323400 RepID=A0ABQ9ITP7_9CUCU|nr:hypothetical protein NQ317_004047 [Molorchus minor]
MDQAHVNTEDFIAQIELHPEIWNIAHEDYNNKITRKAAWEDIVKKHAPNFDEQDPIVMNDVAWPTVGFMYGFYAFNVNGRTSEIASLENYKEKRKEKSGRAFRKQYVYFNNLSFLQSTLKMAPSAIPEEDTSQDFQETNIKEEIIQAPQVTEALEEAETPEETSVFEKKRPAKTKRKETSEEDELYAMLKEKVMKHSKRRRRR